nr:LuxR family transcriptional regulator [Xanthomonas campestris]
MKTARVALVAAVLLQATPAFSAPTAASPLVGTWLLDTSSLPMPEAVRPKRVVLQFKQVSGNKWATHAEIVEHDDTKLQAQSTLLLDGTPGRASGTYLVDRAAVKMPEPGVLVMQLMYQGVPASTRTYTVSADGKVMTEIEAYFKDGNSMMRTAYFKRAPSQSR